MATCPQGKQPCRQRPPGRGSPSAFLSAAIAALLLSMLMSLNPARASQLNLYVGSVPVADQSQAARARAMPQALGQVLSKITGLKSFEEYPGLDEALQDAQTMAITFYYRNRELLSQDGGTSEQLRLQVEFSEPAVDALVQQIPLPIWNPEREPLTVWLVVDDGLERRIMPIDYEYAWAHMADVAETRGLPVAHPQPDADGVYPVDPQLLWGGYTEELEDSGNPDVLLIAALHEGQEWAVRMNLAYTGNRWSWRIADVDLENALVTGINQAIDDISSVNSIAPADQGHWNFEITVAGVYSAADYVRCLKYLQGVSVVDRVRVNEASSGRVRFDLGLNAVPDYLERALASGGVLAPAPGNSAQYTLLQ